MVSRRSFDERRSTLSLQFEYRLLYADAFKTTLLMMFSRASCSLASFFPPAREIFRTGGGWRECVDFNSALIWRFEILLKPLRRPMER